MSPCSPRGPWATTVTPASGCPVEASVTIPVRAPVVAFCAKARPASSIAKTKNADRVIRNLSKSAIGTSIHVVRAQSRQRTIRGGTDDLPWPITGRALPYHRPLHCRRTQSEIHTQQRLVIEQSIVSIDTRQK